MKGQATTKQILKVMSVLQDNLPKEEIESFDPTLAQAIIDGGVAAGREFMRFLKNGARVHVVRNHTIDCSADPFIPNGWTVEEHRKSGDFVWDPNKVGLYLSDGQKNGKVVEGNKLRKELKDKPVLNANVLDYLLAHPELIPEEWKGKYIFFWETIYRDSDGNLNVRYLNWDGTQWNWNYNWLDNDWNDDNPAAVSDDFFVSSPHYFGGVSLDDSCLIQPPSIRPISSNLSEIAMYFLLSRALVSQTI